MIYPVDYKKYIGSFDQIAGVTRARISEGRADNLDAAFVRTGSGYSYTVLPGRGMDIAHAEYKGVPLAFISRAGLSHAAHYNTAGDTWLRQFAGGLLTTCGLSNTGPAEGPHGIHGRIANAPAEQVFAGHDGDTLRVSGTMREAVIFGESLYMKRTIESKFMQSGLTIRDEITNDGYCAAPLMLLYHMNFGFPLLSPESQLTGAFESCLPRDAAAADGAENYAQMHESTHNYAEKVYYATLSPDDNGMTWVALTNHALKLRVTLRFRQDVLPCLTIWKMLGEGDYTLGIEPGNCHPEGRVAAKANNRLEYLKPGAVKRVEISVEIDEILC